MVSLCPRPAPFQASDLLSATHILSAPVYSHTAGESEAPNRFLGFFDYRDAAFLLVHACALQPENQQHGEGDGGKDKLEPLPPPIHPELMALPETPRNELLPFLHAVRFRDTPCGLVVNLSRTASAYTVNTHSSLREAARALGSREERVYRMLHVDNE